MAKEESSPGLFAKVVKFVRNPTTDWADLAEPELDRETAYSKLQLKEMIERKRQNDFVRRREFDQLRKLRSRETRPPPPPADQPSFFASSLTSRPSDNRAGTLKKIDEIEEQMSQQWWKNQKDGKAAAVEAAAAVSAALEPIPPQEAPDSTARQAYLPTEPHELAAAAATGAATEPDLLSAAAPELPSGDLQLAPAAETAGAPLSEPSRFPGESQPVFEHPPELEEAAIRFASDDAAGAELNLRELLAQSPEQTLYWLSLFDLFRATGAQQKFEEAALDYAVRFDKLAPLWSSLPEMTGQLLNARAAVQGKAAQIDWRCPAKLDLRAVTALANRMVDTGPAWHLDWTALNRIEPEAVVALADQFVRWSDSPARLRFTATPVLLDYLASQTLTGDTSTAKEWWRLRLEALRITGQAETFDLTALEFCVTYEVSPPSWTDVRCGYLAQEEAAQTQAGHYVGALQSEFLHSAAAMLDGQGAAAPVAELAGQLLGDASQALVPLEANAGGQQILLVACNKLVRVDFAAAGSILNWTAQLQSAGCQVVFCNLHRLIAVFFNVIGINEHARILPRRD